MGKKLSSPFCFFFFSLFADLNMLENYRNRNHGIMFLSSYGKLRFSTYCNCIWPRLNLCYKRPTLIQLGSLNTLFSNILYRNTTMMYQILFVVFFSYEWNGITAQQGINFDISNLFQISKFCWYNFFKKSSTSQLVSHHTNISFILLFCFDFQLHNVWINHHFVKISPQSTVHQNSNIIGLLLEYALKNAPSVQVCRFPFKNWSFQLF